MNWFDVNPPHVENPYFQQEMLNLGPRMWSSLLQELKPEELHEIRKAAYKAFDKTGLKEKGLDIINITDRNKEEAFEEIKKLSKEVWAKKNALQKLGFYIQAGVAKVLNPISTKKLVGAIADCQTAGYTPTINKFLINMNSAPDLLFHEMGHALTNHKGSFLSKLNIKSRFYALALAPIFLATALIKSPKKDKEAKPENKSDKITTFIKNNCGKLVAASFIPILIDEGLASIKGQKLAKEVIKSDKLLNGLKNTHLKAYGTYILAPILFGGASALLVKLRDRNSKKAAAQN